MNIGVVTIFEATTSIQLYQININNIIVLYTYICLCMYICVKIYMLNCQVSLINYLIVKTLYMWRIL